MSDRVYCKDCRFWVWDGEPAEPCLPGHTCHDNRRGVCVGHVSSDGWVLLPEQRSAWDSCLVGEVSTDCRKVEG